MDFWRALEVLNRRKWLILLSVVVAAALTFGATRLVGARWDATVTFVAPSEPTTGAQSIIDGAPRAAGAGNGRDESKTYQEMYSAIVTSPEVLTPAAQQVQASLPPGRSPLENIQFEAVSSRMYKLHVFHQSPAIAEKLANTLSDGFLAQLTEIRTNANKKLVSDLQKEVDRVDAEILRKSKIQRATAQKSGVMFDIGTEMKTTASQIENIRVKRDNLNQELAAYQASLGLAQQRMSSLNSALNKPHPSLAGAQTKGLASELEKVETRLAQLSARYGDEHPDVKEARANRQELLKRLKDAQSREGEVNEYDRKVAEKANLQPTITDLQTKIAATQSQIGQLDGSLNAATTRLLQTGEINGPATSVSARIELLMNQRNALLQRLNSAQSNLEMLSTQQPLYRIAAVGPLNPPTDTTQGRTMKLVAIAAICAMLGVSALIITLDSADRRLKTIQEAEQVLPAHILAAIPQPETPMSYASLARIAELQPQSLPAEAYRFLGLHLLSAGGSQMRSLMVLSAKAEQGSTTTITNLAITLAQAGKKVILVDANTRTAELHQVFERPNDFGFTDLLKNPTLNAFDRAVQPTSVENLSMVTSGTSPENRWELFRSDNLQLVSQHFRNMADFVLYDTPSGVLFTDALNLAPVVDGAVLCVRALEALTGEERRLIDLVNESNVKVLGAVLSDMPVTMVAGYENYQHYYAPTIRALAAPSIEAPFFDNMATSGISMNGNGNGNGNGTHMGLPTHVEADDTKAKEM